MDKLKKYLQEQREELDSDTPGGNVWQRITQTQQDIQPKGKIRSLVWRYAAAACTIAFISAGILFLNKDKYAGKTPGIADYAYSSFHGIIKTSTAKNRKAVVDSPSLKNEPAIKIASESSEKNNPPRRKEKIKYEMNPADKIVYDVRNNYSQLVNMQINKLNKMPLYAESADYFNTFKIKLRQLDTDEVLLRKEIKKQGLNDGLLQQLININQQKLNVLKTLQTEVNKINNRVEPDQIKQDSVKISFLNI